MTTVPSPAPALLNPTRLAYRGEGPVVVRGPATGFAYVFSGLGDTLDVDERDAAGLLQLGHFEPR
ncbi:MAG TPA: hypothetical protein VH482_14635 [Thermomicrobiales bacterium]